MTDAARVFGRRLLKRFAMRVLRHGAEHLDDHVFCGMGVARADIEAAIAGTKRLRSGRCRGSAVCQIEAAPLG
ncbi:MAG: hypothetical protein HC855_04565 [Rhizobiales bacterium]|nr:hypothetical protein [Hyphomicrobiales bacterium]